jgi:hypothetical protein
LEPPEQVDELPAHHLPGKCSLIVKPYNPVMATARRRRRPARNGNLRSAAARLREAERLFTDFAELTPYPFKPFTRSFDSFDEYERWKRAQTNPWYR